MRFFVVTIVLWCSSSALAAGDGDESMGRRVQELLRAHQSDIFGCVEKAGATPEHEMLVRVAAGERGQVALAEVLKTGTGGEVVGACIVGRIRAWDITALGMAPGDQVVLPLAFKPDTAKAQMEVVQVTPTSRIDCGQAPEQAFYVLDGPVNINDTLLFSGDAIWLPPSTACTLRPGERAVFRVLRVRSQMAAGTSEPRQAFTVRNSQPKSLPILGGKANIKLYLDGRGTGLALDIMVSEAGTKVPPHVHDKSDELIHIVAGKAVTVVGGKPVASETFRIPAGVEHSLSVDQKLTAVQVYAPGGPEQRFKGTVLTGPQRKAEGGLQ